MKFCFKRIYISNSSYNNLLQYVRQNLSKFLLACKACPLLCHATTNRRFQYHRRGMERDAQSPLHYLPDLIFLCDVSTYLEAQVLFTKVLSLYDLVLIKMYDCNIGKGQRNQFCSIFQSNANKTNMFLYRSFLFADLLILFIHEYLCICAVLVSFIQRSGLLKSLTVQIRRSL